MVELLLTAPSLCILRQLDWQIDEDCTTQPWFHLGAKKSLPGVEQRVATAARSNHNESTFYVRFLIVYMHVKGVTEWQILENHGVGYHRILVT